MADVAEHSSGSSRAFLIRDASSWAPAGFLAGLAAVAATTLLIYPLREITPAVSNGVVYMLAVLAISFSWGRVAGLFTAVASAVAFNFFHIPPTGRLTVAEPENYVALGVFLAAAFLASAVADLARERTREAERRREEADLAADLARSLLGEAELADALGPAAHRIAESMDLPSAAIEVQAVAAGERHHTLPLELGEDRQGALVVPASIPAEMLERLRATVVPALEAILAAALRRDALLAEVVETRALRRSDAVKTALLRSVSHDLRTPLTTILASSAALASRSTEPVERRELAESIGEQASRLARMVDQLLDLSRLEAGAAEPRRDWTSLDEVIRAAVAEVGDWGESGFTLSLDRDLPLLEVDAAQLERALVNIFENSRRHSAGHPVKVRAGVVGQLLAIRIVDRGPGIPGPELERIFEPFYRGAERDRPGGGAGLGLAIARGFIEANGGLLGVESLPGQGTTFVIEFPVPAETPARGEAGRTA